MRATASPRSPTRSGRVTQYAYDGNSDITQIVDAAGRTTALAYHPIWNKVTSITRGLAGGTAVTYRFEYEDSAFERRQAAARHRPARQRSPSTATPTPAAPRGWCRK
jgi:YD repeat-containing protein